MKDYKHAPTAAHYDTMSAVDAVITGTTVVALVATVCFLFTLLSN